MTKYLHTMIRVSSLENTVAFFEVLGLHEIRRRPGEKALPDIAARAALYFDRSAKVLACICGQ
jgi:catechol 2,3-dioxygenase-like lactoylglutathione lyase family enzyme